jgi:signal transduction histidine kinase
MAQEMINQQKKEIEHQRDQLQNHVATKDKLFSIIAHDLRNPLHSILGFSELLVKNSALIEEQKKQEYIKLINESALHTHMLLENLLQWSRTQTDRIKFSPVMMDLYTVVEEAQNILKSSFEKKKLTFTSQVVRDTMVYADKNMVQTIIGNLLGNAIKFTPESGKITVSLQDQDNNILISISDTGIGINKEDLQKILNTDYFHTTPGTNGEAGTGLGINLCQDFVRRHGSTLNIESEPGKGSTLSFTLSKKPAE